MIKNGNYLERLNSCIPGGAHTYSRGYNQYSENSPHILSHGKDSYVWDDGNRKYLDYGMGLRAVTVGYAHESIANAACEEILKGNCLTRPSITELQAAELMIDLIPSAEMVKFAKNGSTVTTAAVKLARAYTGRKYIAICEDQPFFSYDDWFIGSTSMAAGIPDEIKSLTLKFRYNDINSLERLFAQYPDQIAAVILEPATTVEPVNNFLQNVKKTCESEGTLFILDEMITGFRWHLNGAQTYYGVEPDLSTFGKGMANGFSVAALVGKEEIMELGSADSEDNNVFLISTTHGGEMCGLGALIKTVEEYEKHNIINHLWSYGEQLINGMNKISQEHGVSDNFEVVGVPCSPNYITKDDNGNVSFEFKTLFMQEMIKNNILMPWIALSYSHGETELSSTFEALDSTLGVYKKALESGVGKYLKGRPVSPVFRK